MTNKTAVCAIAASVLVAAASLSLPAFAQSGSAFSGHTKKIISTSAAYRAGLQHGIALRSAYDRGYIDGTRMVASRSSVGTVNPSLPSSEYSTDYQNSSGYHSAGYNPPTGRASPYEGLYASTQIPDGDVAAGYDASQAIPQYSAEAYRYCVARYRSFDPAAGTFLAYDGNRYYCR
jgi:BA14K-like protein